MRIEVRDLAREVTEADLAQAFEAFGQVLAVRLFKRKEKGKVRWHAEVQMADPEEAQAAIRQLKGRNLKGRPLQFAHAGGRVRLDHEGGSRRHASDKKGGARGAPRL